MEFTKSQSGELTLTRYPACDHMPRHSHESSKVSFVMAGSVRENSNCGEQFAVPGSVFVKPAGFVHEDTVAPTGLAVLTIRPSQASPIVDETWRRLVSEYRTLQFDPCIKKILVLWAAGIEGDESVLEEVILNLAETPKAQSKDRWYRRALSILADRIADPPSLVELADQVAVHPVTLSRAFASMGTSKAATIHGIRMRAALSLVSTDKSLNWIAAELGYADLSHFSRTFRKWLGCSPESYRKTFCANR